MRRTMLAVSAATALTATAIAGPAVVAQDVAEAEPGQSVNLMLLPKFLGILPFDQANQGAQEAHDELQNQGEYLYTGPTAELSVAGQIETVTNASTQGFDVVMLSNNAGDQIAPVAAASAEAGTPVVTWDSAIPSAEGEALFVAQVDFNDIGVVMADMSLSIMGEEGGDLAILSASPDAANQNAWNAAFLNALETDPQFASINYLETVFGNDKSEDSYTQALALIDKYPDLKVIMSPTSVGIVAAAKAVQDEGLCDEVKVSGLGVPFEMLDYTLSGCAPEFALWDFVDLGYLTYYTSYLLATGAIEGVEGETFKLGRPIVVSGEDTFTITQDPTRDAGLRVLMGPFTVFDKDNVEAAAG